MATDSVITFNYSDGVPLVTFCIKSDSHLNIFIPTLQRIISEVNSLSMYRSWSYVVAEVLSRLIQDEHFRTLIRLSHIHYKSEDCNVIYKHVITINEDYYANNSNKLENFIMIESEYPISKQKIVNCILNEYPKELLK